MKRFYSFCCSVCDDGRCPWQTLYIFDEIEIPHLILLYVYFGHRRFLFCLISSVSNNAAERSHLHSCMHLSPCGFNYFLARPLVFWFAYISIRFSLLRPSSCRFSTCLSLILFVYFLKRLCFSHSIYIAGYRSSVLCCPPISVPRLFGFRLQRQSSASLSLRFSIFWSLCLRVSSSYCQLANVVSHSRYYTVVLFPYLVYLTALLYVRLIIPCFLCPLVFIHSLCNCTFVHPSISLSLLEFAKSHKNKDN